MGKILGDLMISPSQERSEEALAKRRSAAEYQAGFDPPIGVDNGDEARYSNKIGTFTKCLPHSSLGEVDLKAYGLLSDALAGTSVEAFETVPTVSTLRLGSPLSSRAFDSFGPDARGLGVPTPCSVDSDEFAAQFDGFFKKFACQSRVNIPPQSLRRYLIIF